MCTPDRELEACVGGFSVARSQISPNAMTHETRCGELSVLTRRGVVEARRGEAGQRGEGRVRVGEITRCYERRDHKEGD